MLAFHAGDTGSIPPQIMFCFFSDIIFPPPPCIFLLYFVVLEHTFFFLNHVYAENIFFIIKKKISFYSYCLQVNDITEDDY